VFAITFFADLPEGKTHFLRKSRDNYSTGGVFSRVLFGLRRHLTIVSNVIYMEEPTSVSPWRSIAVRDRRYSIRYPFAADAELLELETAAATSGVTSDLSIGGTFVCASKPLSLGSRIRLTMTRKEQVVEALAVVRIVKPRIGMGIEFLDVEAPYDQTLFRWIEQLRRK
jgi:hypothetical protein